MSKLDQLKALGVARRARKNTPEASGTARKAPSGLLLGKPKRGSARASTIAKVGDGIALTSMAHPPGLIEKIAGAVRSGKLKISPPNPVAKATKGRTGTAVGAAHVRGSTTGTGLRVGAAVAVQPATSEIMDATSRERPAPVLKRGRPKSGKPRPWEVERVSKRTWYRRKREAEKAK